MPIYEYLATTEQSCEYCKDGFETIQSLKDASIRQCPKCGAPISRAISAPSLGRSASSLDDRAKAAGFTKLKRLGKGEYEKQY